ncbi:MAG: hypothetical protein FWE88_00535 [Phycisphaerae bacterium]|nr:hypothetical protein [Phycisphaerae bacterium]
MSRIARIEAMLASSPADAFLHYSLGMEYASAGDVERAARQFLHVLELDAEYLPAYVEAGKCLRSAGRLAEARDLFARGLHLAESRRDPHLADHIRQQLESVT